MIRSTALVSTLWILLTLGCRHKEAPRHVEVLTTPDAAEAGIPQRLMDEFRRETGVAVELRIVTKEQIANETSEFVAIIRDPDDREALSQRAGVQLKSIAASEDFIVAGPPRDPAKVRGASSGAEALRRIAAKKQPFCSPADVQVLHNRELDFWSQARVNPASNRHYRKCPGTAVDVLARCSQLGAYTVTDRDSLSSAKVRDITALLSNEPGLHSDYTIALIRPSSPTPSRNAAWFVEWLMSYRGREIVRAIRRQEHRPIYAPDER